MSLTDRDRKIVLLLVPVIVVMAYWFLLMAPKREEAATAGQELAAQEQRRDDAQLRLASLAGARTDFAADYAELVRLGKAVPTAVDMPTVLVQLEDAARGTGIKFTRITAQEREAAAVPVAPPPGSDSSGSNPATAGGEPAQSGPGTAGESAGNAVSSANDSNAAAAEQSGVAASDTQTSQPANDGSLPVGGGTAASSSTDPATGAPVPGLDTVGLELEFTGNFLDLSDFFHRVKRYVELDGEQLNVRGRLLTVDGVEFESDPDIFPRIVATLTATVYLAPEIQGATAGATPGGPAVIPASSGDAAAPLATSTPTSAAR
jgi:type II secretory pathway component PulM